jgi:hypothetical protein
LLCLPESFSASPQRITQVALIQGALKEAARGTSSGRARLRQGLVIAEVALTFVLLIGAGFLLLSFHRFLRVNAGFTVERVLTFQINLPERKYARRFPVVLWDEDLWRARRCCFACSADIGVASPVCSRISPVTVSTNKNKVEIR